METLWLAFALILVIEGILYALFPSGMKVVLEQLLDIPADRLRWYGLGAAAFGVLLVYIIRG